jgi:hypothetical protein
LQKFGLLLLSDPKLPSVAGIVAGEPIRGSWWGHPRVNEIFRTTQYLSSRSDVLVTKLIFGKVTFLHLKLWPAFLTIARSHQSWQKEGLSQSARSLLGKVNRQGVVRADRLSTSITKQIGNTVRELERRLLIYAEEFHSEIGTHVKMLESWDHWIDRKKYKLNKLSLLAARNRLEEICETFSRRSGTIGKLPWVG